MDPTNDPAATPAPTAAPSFGAVLNPALNRLVTEIGVGPAKLQILGLLAQHFRDEGTTDEDARLATLARDLDARENRIALLESELALARGLVLPDAATLARTVQYVARLRRESADAHAPLTQPELDRVETLFSSGQVGLGRAFGEALLARSLAQGQAPFRRAAPVRLEEAPAQQPTSAATEARLLRQRGWSVQLSQDGARIEHASPPKKDATARAG